MKPINDLKKAQGLAKQFLVMAEEMKKTGLLDEQSLAGLEQIKSLVKLTEEMEATPKVQTTPDMWPKRN